MKQEYADSLQIQFVETSAKNSTNVDNAFLTMAKQIKSKMGNAQPTPGVKKEVNITSEPVQKPSGGCC